VANKISETGQTSVKKFWKYRFHKMILLGL